MIGGSTTRREWLRTGGRALAGLALAGLARPVRGLRLPGRAEDPEPLVIHMRADVLGSRVRFDPVGVLIEPGRTVRWVVERHAHTATAYHPDNDGSPLHIPPGGDPWDSGYLVNPGDAFEITLTVEGVYDYYCRPHEAAGMVGRIVVQRPGGGWLDAGEWPERAGGRPVPDAARRAFPSVARILAEGVVRGDR